MLKIFSKLALLIAPTLLYGQGNEQYVNPFIGTDKSEIYTKWGDHGGLYPGAVAPWGMAQLSPETGMDSPSRGYFYSEDNIFYFGCTGHWSGYPNGSAGRLHLMFYNGEPQHSRRLNHDGEHAQVGYYSITFDEGDRVEATATSHVGLFRYTPSSESFSIKIFEQGVELVDSSTLLLERYRAKLHLSRPISSYSEGEDDLTLIFEGDEQLLVKVALSAIDAQSSDMNVEGEMPDWNFDLVRNQTRFYWKQELAVVDVEGGTEDDRVKFYTALYHSMLIPTIASDIHYNPHYEICSSWDTFRTLHPLLTLLKPDVQSDILGSWLKIYERSGRLPVGPMTGLHTIPIYLDSYRKGIRDFDTNLAAKAMRELWEEETPWMESYKRYGYVNDSIGRGVSITLDLAYDDWAMAEFLEAIGSEDQQLISTHRDRSYNFAHHFDSERLFMTPRDVTTGFVRDMGERGYQETDRWTASWFAPHDVQSLINLYGGNDQFTEQLDRGYSQGVMLHDNEPVLHYPYLYSYTGEPWRASEEIAYIMSNNYLNSPGGIPGNDDLGSISSWYVFNAMGIYPICPGVDQYIINTPLFDRVTIKLEDDKEFVIEASGEYETMPYVKSIKLNDKEINNLYITHEDIISGGRLEVERSSRAELPLAEYGKPSSQSGLADGYSISSVTLSSQSVKAGEPITIHFTITGGSELGSYVAEAVSKGEIVASKHIKIAPKEIKEDSITFSLYGSGRETILFAGKPYVIKVGRSPSKGVKVICTAIESEQIYSLGGSVELEVSIKNISSDNQEGVMPLMVEGKSVGNIPYTLSPGEQQSYKAELALERGLSLVRVADRERAIRVYGSAEESLLLDLEFRAGAAYDISGFDNVPTLYRGAKIIEDGTQEVLYLESGAYLMVAPSKSLDTKGKTLTMMLWIKPTLVEGTRYVDFFTKGDYNSLKMGNPRELNFFTGGWGRGSLEVDVDKQWYNNWHHLVGVCDGGSLRLYIDGEQVGELPIKDNILSTEPPWALGCNAEMPYERNYTGAMDRVRIYAGALTPEQILSIYSREESDYKQ